MTSRKTKGLMFSIFIAVFCAIALINMDVSIKVENIVFVIGGVYDTLANILIHLSHKSLLGNIFAWGILLLLSLIPILIFFIYNRKKLSQNIILLSCFSLFIFFSMYGYINNLFIHDELLVAVPYIREILATTIMFIILLFIVALAYNTTLKHLNDSKTLLLYFRKFLIVLGICGIVPLAVFSALRFISNSGDMLSIVDVFLFILTQLMIFNYIPMLIEFLDAYLNDSYSIETLTVTNKLYAYSKKILSFTIYSSLIFSIFKLLLAQGLDNVHFEFSIPWFEMFTSFALCLFSGYVARSVEIREENKQFI